MRAGVLKKNESNSRSAPNCHAPRNTSANSRRLTCTDATLSAPNQGVAGRARAGALAARSAAVGSLGVSTEVIELHCEFAPEGVVKPAKLRKIVDIEDIAGPRDIHGVYAHDAAGPRAH